MLGLIALALAFVAILFLLLFLIFFRPSKSQGPQTTPSPTPFVLPEGQTKADLIKISIIEPGMNATRADYTGKVSVVFSKPVSVNDVELSLSPATPGQLSQASDFSVVFTPSSYLKPNTKYTATLSVNGQPLILPDETIATSFSWSFTTDQTSGEEGGSPQEIQQMQNLFRQAEESYNQRKAEFPFIVYLPYQTNNFKVEITSSDEIVITTYGQSASQTQAYRQQALNWLTQNGGNVSQLKIQYVQG